MTTEERAKYEFKRGVQALLRGRSDLAAIRFRRAQDGGLDIAQETAKIELKREKVGQTRPSEADDMKALRESESEGSKRLKEWKDKSIVNPPPTQPSRALLQIGGDAPGASDSQGSGMPSGQNGDILININGAWVVLENPGTPSETPKFDFILRHNGTVPYWYTPVAC